MRRAKARVHRGEPGGEISPLREREGAAGHGQHVGADVAVDREQRARGDQSRAGGSHGDAGGVGERTDTVSGIRDQVDDDELQQRVEREEDRERGEQRERDIPLRVARLAHRIQRGLITAIGEEQQQHRLQPAVETRFHRSRRDLRMAHEIDRAGDAHHGQRQELRDHRDVADPRTGADAPVIDRRQRAEEDRNHRKPRERLGRRRPEFPEVNDQEVHGGGARGEPAQERQPAYLNPHETPERVPQIEVSSAGLVELRGNFRVAGNDDAHAGARDQHRPHTPLTHQCRDRRRQAEDAAAEDAVDRECYHAPAADGADQLRRRAQRRPGRHRILVA